MSGSSSPESTSLAAAATELERLLRRTAGAEGGPPQLVVDRLRDSVLRPLQDVSASSPHPEEPETGDGWRARLGELAQAVTVERVASGDPKVAEAAAALQDLAILYAGDPNDADDRLAQLRDLQAGLAPTIQVAPDGPYLVTNVPELSDWLGQPVPARPQLALCRCGASAMKPHCDGSHAHAGFSGAKDPGRVEDRRDTYVGQQLTILDNRGTCQHSGFCTDRLATVFRQAEEPFVAPSGGRMDEIVRAVRDCPSGALSYALDGKEAREQVDLHGSRDPHVEITKDGPYRVTGGLPLLDGDGNDHDRNQGASREHYALCRCGHSRNKPFCSGMHWYVDFHDPVPVEDHEPSIFEWAGGVPALTRMTRLFYERYVPDDPLLAPLFADMSAHHPQRVAKWLGEVFGGPRRYSQDHCGYPQMVSQHLGKGLTEEQRARWVMLMRRSALEAGLPNDPEFRSAFESYIEWGSRLAVENSQPGARPPERMPMPHWDWRTAAGPPGARISALEPPSTDAEQAVVLPGPDEPVNFDQHIKPPVPGPRPAVHELRVRPLVP